MKKSVLTLTLMIMVVLSTYAQFPFTIGIKGSVNSSKITTDNYSLNGVTLNDFVSDSKSGYDLGVFARLGNKLYLQPELLYNVKKGKSFSGTTIQNLDIKSIQVPLLLGVKVIDFKAASIRAFTGPAMSFVMNNSDITYEGVTSGLYDTKNYKNNIWDWQLGGGIDIGPLIFDVRYEWGLSNVSDGNINAIGFVNKGNTLTFSLGFKFL